jgi:hypothetical protein
MLPKQTGVNALYCRQQITEQHLPQHFQPHKPSRRGQAEAGAEVRARAAMLTNPARRNLFMVTAVFPCSPGRAGPNHLPDGRRAPVILF